jgi:beta-glucosidase
MESRAYIQHLARLVKEGKVKMSVIDDAVRRILRKKYELGLFADPYKFSNVQREKDQWNNPQHLAVAKEVAAKSMVLLKNDQQLLPISKQTKKIALIGPLVKAIKENLGFWSYDWDDDSARVASLYQSIQNKIGGAQLLYAKGCELTDSSKAGFAAAVDAANQSDVVVIYVGETRNMSGEAKSRSNIHLPGVQEELIKAVAATGKPVIVLIAAGRPLVFNWTAEHVPAILYTWWLGTKGADAIADVLFGDYNPSGKLPMTFPRSEGQIPIYYNYFNTGRPAKKETDFNYVSAYTDLLNSPQYPFGFGLSYSTFQYSDIQLNKTTIKPGETLTATVTVTNNGIYDGEEVVQLYIRDITGSVVRPVKELKGFKKIKIGKGETKQVQFTLTANDLRFYNDQLQYIYEPGEFKLFIGTNSRDVKEATFELKK